MSGVGAGLTLSAFSSPEAATPLPRRLLGQTGLQVTILGLGCAAIGYGRHTVEEGAAVIEACLDEGINYIDCASTYGNAEVKLGEVMKRRRNEAIITTKTLKRGYEEAWEEINTSLEQLKTDSVDLLQLHAINSFEDLDRITAKDGSLGAALRAKEEGMASHIGISGHTRPEVVAEALKRFPFETTLVPLSSTDKLVHDFGETLFPLAKEQKFGIIAMKVLAAGRVTQHVPESLRYSLSLPVSTAIVGMSTAAEVKENVHVARSFSPMDLDEMKAILRRQASCGGNADKSLPFSC
jgi:aryl-alcohol dehydrogenase-like predicted oxidoreductase